MCIIGRAWRPLPVSSPPVSVCPPTLSASAAVGRAITTDLQPVLHANETLFAYGERAARTMTHPAASCVCAEEGQRPATRTCDVGRVSMSVATLWRTLVTVLTAGMLVALLVTRSGAQTVPLRLVQGSDGSLYLVQGGSRWLIVPDQVSDEELAALVLDGEIDGTLPGEITAASSGDIGPTAGTAVEADVAASSAPPAPVSAEAPAIDASTTVATPAPTVSGGRTRSGPVGTPLPAATPLPTPTGGTRLTK